MTKYKNTYRMESIRLKGYDYQSSGYYFVTICTKNEKEYFGKISGNSIILNEIGKAAENIWENIPTQFEMAGLDEYVIMPNHVHGIIIINSSNTTKNTIGDKGGFSGLLNPQLSNHSLSKIIRWFKGRSRYEINKLNPTLNFAWQPRFYEHIIRGEKALFNIRNYIINNPVKAVKVVYNNKETQ